MFVVILRFSDAKANAGQFMKAHNEWLQRGFDDGVWITTLVACSELTEVEPCSDMPEVDSSRVLFVSGSDGQALSLQGEFSRGGCDNTPMKACYAALPSGGGAQILRVWLEPAKPLAVCEVPFIAEAIFSLAPLRERYGDDHEAVVIKVGAYAFPFAL